MAGTWLFLTLVGPTAAHLLTVSESPVYLSTGDTALLSASLNFSTLVPEYFQLRWRFDTGSCLVLIIKADNCMTETGFLHWRDSCRVNIVKTERYRHRTELSYGNASLVLQNVSAEDSGNYSITVLAFNLMLSANILLTVTDVEHPVSSVVAEVVSNYKVTNIIQLSLAGVILCLLGLIIAEYISFTHCKEKEMEAKSEQETTQWYQDGLESTSLPLPGNIFLLLEMPSSEDFDGLCYNSSY